MNNKIKNLNKQKSEFTHYLKVGEYFSPQLAQDTSLKKLDAGIYAVGSDRNGSILFAPISTMTDGLVDLPDSTSQKVIDEVKTFQKPSTKEKFDKYQVIYKRGILMYGKPGTGKTVTIVKIMESVVNSGGIVLFGPPPELFNKAANIIRGIEGNVPLLVVYEEFDTYLRDSSMLSLLDGELQVDNVVYLATTNYIESIPDRIKNRPSRFATVIEIGVPSKEARRAFFEQKLSGEDLAQVEALTNATSGFVVDQLKDVIVSVFCFGVSLDEAVKKIKAMGEVDEVSNKTYSKKTLPATSNMVWASIDSLRQQEEKAVDFGSEVVESALGITGSDDVW